MGNTKEQEPKKYIKCGDCSYYSSGWCFLFSETRYGYNGCLYGKTGGLHPDVIKAYKNRRL